MSTSSENISSRPPKLRILRTISIFITFSALGVQMILGPTMPDIEILFNTDTKTIGLSYVSCNVGFIGGALFSGVVIDRFNQELIFGLSGILSAVVVGASTYMGSVVPFIIAFGVTTFSNGLCDSGGQPYILGLWKGSKFQDSVMQLCHFGWCVGSTLAPILVKPFLIKRNEDKRIFNNSDSVEHLPLENSTHGYLNDSVPVSTTHVQYGYLLVAGYIFIASLFSIFVFCLAGPSFRSLPFVKASEEETPKAKSKYSNICFILYVSMLLGIYVGLELTFGGFITSFVVKGSGWSNRKGTYITTIYWGSFGVGRLLCVPVSLFLSPRFLLNIVITLANASLLCILFLVHVDERVIWICTAVFGVAMGPMFASFMSWTSRYINVTGPVSAILFVGNSLGALVFPPLTAYLFQTFGIMFLVYSCLFLSIALLVFFVVGQFIAARLTLSNLKVKDTSSVTEEQQQTETMLPLSEK